MTRALLDKELQELDAQVIRLGSLVDDALAQALAALETADQNKAGAVVMSDTLIDDLHLAIEEHTFRILTLQQPLAGRDLRYLTSVAPIAIDLERMGDEAEAIALNVLRMAPFGSGGVLEAGTHIQQEQAESSPVASGGEGDQFIEASIIKGILDLSQQVRSLLRETMKAFAGRDTEAAHRLWEKDTVIDRRSYVVRRDAMAILESAQAIPALQHDSHMMQRATCLLWIAHELERVADHCTNICERIVFIKPRCKTLGFQPGIEGAFLVWGLGGVDCLTLSSALLYNVSMNTKIAYKSNRNVSYSCTYHVVWCPKYRRKVLVEQIAARLEQIIREVCEEHQSEILSLEIMPDHLHLVVECDPPFGIHRLVRRIKGRSSRFLRQEFPTLKTRMPTLWTNSYFVSTVGGAPLSVIKQYIENQKHV